MTETYWCPGPWPWQWARTCTREVPDPVEDPCQAASCVSAKAKLAEARRRFDGACTGLRMVRAVMDLLRPILATPFWVIVVMILIAAIVWGPVAVVIWGLIAIWGISWFLMLVLGRMAQSFAATLVQATQDVRDAIPGVVANCPAQCRGDLSVPTCEVG